MLTIFGREGRRRLSATGLRRRDFIKIGGLSMGSLMSLSLADLFRAEARAGTQVLSQGGDQHLPGWRATAPGHVGDQDRGTGRDPGRVQADRDQGSGH